MVDESDGPYNPLDKLNLARSIAEALLSKVPESLDRIEPLPGAGVYVIYYTGDHELYEPIAWANGNGIFNWPIYVGKAIPKGGRKGGLTKDASKGNALISRLSQHAASLEQVASLDLADFFYRSLVIEDIWIPLGENILIEQYKPVWNLSVDGFGNKDVGKGRASQARSNWDVLHPGRLVVEKQGPGKKTVDQIEASIRNHYDKFVPTHILNRE